MSDKTYRIYHITDEEQEIIYESDNERIIITREQFTYTDMTEEEYYNKVWGHFPIIINRRYLLTKKLSNFLDYVKSQYKKYFKSECEHKN